MRVLLTALSATLTLAACPSLACPWANGDYRGAFSPDYELTLSVNADCTAVHVVETFGNVTADVVMRPKGRGWEARLDDGARLQFDQRGRSVRASRGGLSRSVRMQKLN